MKSFVRLLCSVFFLVLILPSCQDDREKIEAKNPNTPKALQGGTSDVGSSIYKSRGNDLVEDIYQELLEKRPDLKKLDEDIAAYNAMEPDSLVKYGKYERKSTFYYEAANMHINTITDSVLKKQIQQVIAASHSRYDNKVATINKMIDALGKADTSLKNYHAVLKLLVTLPVMEQFQNDELPNDKVLHTLTTTKHKLINRTQKLTPRPN